jgi:hypothetical protein
MVEIYMEKIRDLLHSAAKQVQGTPAGSTAAALAGGMAPASAFSAASDVDMSNSSGGGGDNLKVFESAEKGIYVDGATEVLVSEPSDLLGILRWGQQNRATAATGMNAFSSRSHSIFMLMLEQRNLADLTVRTGKLYLVDLAGSEKVRKTGSEGLRLDEAKKINRSLTTLGMVINALTDGVSTHVPYRDSKLTRVLQVR